MQPWETSIFFYVSHSYTRMHKEISHQMRLCCICTPIRNLCRRWVPLLLTAAQCQQHPATEEMDFEEEAAANAPAAQPRRKRSLSALCCSSGASSVSQVQLWWRARAFLCGAGITVNRSFLINFFRRLLPGRGNVLKCSFLLFFCLYMFLGWFLKGTKL